MAVTFCTDEEWVVEARNVFMREFGLSKGQATAAAKALLAREQEHHRSRTASMVVWEHMDSDEPPIIDPDGDYPEDEAP